MEIALNEVKAYTLTYLKFQAQAQPKVVFLF